MSRFEDGDGQSFSSSTASQTVQHRPLVLVVDDDLGVRCSVSRVLEKSGFSVVTANTGMQALQRVQCGCVAAVVMDVFMPEQDGIETIRELRLLSPSLPVVAVSGGPSVFLRAARAFGASVTIEKPFDSYELAEIIKALLLKGGSA